MGTPSGVNLTELRGVLLGLRGAGFAGPAVGCDPRVRDAAGRSGTGATGVGGTAGGGAASTGAAERGAGRAVLRTTGGRKAHAANARRTTRAAATAKATPWPRRKIGLVPLAPSPDTGCGRESAFVRVGTACQGSGSPGGRILVGANARVGGWAGAMSVGAGQTPAPEGVGTTAEGAMGISASGAVKW